MKLNDIVEKLSLEVVCAPNGLDIDVRRGYASDLLSDVIANSRSGDIWVTLQIHQNIVAVASLNSLSAILLVNGRKPDGETVGKAETEGVVIVTTSLPAFEIIGRLYELGINGIEDGGGN